MRDGTQTKETILREATRLVEQRGFTATSLNDLFLAAGIKKGAFYHHFPAKDDLGLAILERTRTAFLDWLDGLLAAPTPLEGLHSFFAAALGLHRKRGFVGGCLFGNTALEMSDVSRQYADVVERVFQEWCGRIEEVVRAAQESGQIRNDISAGDLAQTVVATIEGGIMLSRLKKEEGPLKTCLESLKLFLRMPA
jgi:TetR/AcrR family transcriptional repressor of nem operon